jgi:hypothetical protein
VPKPEVHFGTNGEITTRYPSGRILRQSTGGVGKVTPQAYKLIEAARTLQNMATKAEKIKKWIKNAVTVNKDNGDAWAHLLRFEFEFGTAES